MPLGKSQRREALSHRLGIIVFQNQTPRVRRVEIASVCFITMETGEVPWRGGDLNDGGRGEGGLTEIRDLKTARRSLSSCGRCSKPCDSCPFPVVGVNESKSRPLKVLQKRFPGQFRRGCSPGSNSPRR